MQLIKWLVGKSEVSLRAQPSSQTSVTFSKMAFSEEQFECLRRCLCEIKLLAL